MDAARKKASFLNHAGRILNLKDYRVLHLRIEKMRTAEGMLRACRATSIAAEPSRSGGLAPVAAVGPFDVVISRALAGLAEYLAMARPFIAEKGLIVAMKGRISEAEMSSARRLLSAMRPAKARAPEVSVRRYRLPVFENERSIVAVKFE